MEPNRKPNPIVRYALIIAVLGIFLYTYLQERKPRVETGTLEYRMVTGLKQGIFQVILIETSDRYFILDSTFRETLTPSEGELITRPKQLKLMESYQNLEYRIGFKEESSQTSPAYRVTRELFNSVNFGDPIRYEVNKKQKDALIQLAK